VLQFLWKGQFKMDLGLKGKTAVVSGSTAGIGFGIAAALAEEGARVVVNGRTEARVTAQPREPLPDRPRPVAVLRASLEAQAEAKKQPVGGK